MIRIRSLKTWSVALGVGVAFACLGLDCQPPRQPVTATAVTALPSATGRFLISPVIVTQNALPVVPPANVSDGGARCFECEDGRFVLRDDWRLQAAAKVKRSGKEISLVGFQTPDWISTSVPSTVLAALVDKGVYPDPFLRNNLATIPSAPFGGSYWYRREFTLSADFDGQVVWLNLDGINYRANLWLNGELIASSKDLVGTFTTHEWNVSAQLRTGQPNALALEIFPPDPKRDLALSWLDWNPTPADRNMGIWRDVYLKKSGPVALRGSRVSSKVDLATLDKADLTIKAELNNVSDRSIDTVVEARIAPSEFGVRAVAHVSQSVTLAAHETRTVVFDAAHYPALTLVHPKLWWPAQMGAPDQYDLWMSVSAGDVISDAQPARFGVRDVSFEPTTDGARVFRINGKRIMVRGGGWASDLLLRTSNARLETELALVKDLGLNTIRLEGKLESDDFYAKADAAGVLTIPGWMCCDAWQTSKSWNVEQRAVGLASMASQARRLRNHPSVIDFFIGSDEALAPDVERGFVAELQKADWPMPITPAASDRTSPLLGRSGVKMTGPYDWVPPAYWYQDRAHGGAFGFNSETGPGPAIPELETLRSWLAADELESLWSKPKARLLHAGTSGMRFDNLAVFNEALSKRHGKATSLDDYVLKAQVMNYEAQRAMFEAYGRNKYASTTGIVQWLLNSAWPSLIWHLYGHDFSTAGGYYGAKKANEPLHIQYSYDDRSIVVVNHTQEPTQGLSAAVRVYDSESQQRFALDFPVSVAADSSSKVMALPEIERLTTSYFVKLSLLKGTNVVSTNWYWLSLEPEVSDFKRTDWGGTPTLHFADFSGLSRLAPATVKAVILPRTSTQRRARVQLRNTSRVIAFFVRLKLSDGKTGKALLPALWQDNYLSLLPGEKREVAVDYSGANEISNAEPSVDISGWNVSRSAASAVAAQDASGITE